MSSSFEYHLKQLNAPETWSHKGAKKQILFHNNYCDRNCLLATIIFHFVLKTIKSLLKTLQINKALPPFLHLEKQPTSLISPIMPSMQPNHHIINICTSTVVPLILHPPKNQNAVFNWTLLRYLLHHFPKKKNNKTLFFHHLSKKHSQIITVTYRSLDEPTMGPSYSGPLSQIIVSPTCGVRFMRVGPTNVDKHCGGNGLFTLIRRGKFLRANRPTHRFKRPSTSSDLWSSSRTFWTTWETDQSFWNLSPWTRIR